MDEFRRVGIIGIGLVGGSLGLAIKALADAPEVVGVARRPETVQEALAAGAIDAGSTSPEDTLPGCDLVFVATPVSAIVPATLRAAKLVAPGAVITDVGSTKRAIVAEAEASMPPGISFVGGHPMSGSEQRGVAHAHADLLRNTHYLLTPTPSTDMRAFGRLQALLTRLGARVIALDPVRHDRVMASISHLPHLAATALVNVAADEASEADKLLLLAAGGFRDSTRIAASSPGLWADIYLDNRGSVLDALEAYKREIGNLCGLIESGDRARLVERLRQAAEARRAIPVAAEVSPEDLRDLLIPVTDHPGAISEITLVVGREGINIENVEIIHSTEDAGVLRLTVAGPDTALRAQAALAAKGYSVEVHGAGAWPGP